MRQTTWTLRLVGFLVSAFTVCLVAADDWPTYQHDYARVGATPEKLRLPLQEAWVFSSYAAPRPANTGPDNRMMEGHRLRGRITFDEAFPVAAVGRQVYFGSSVDHQVRCLDAATGRTIWRFYTEASVRLAPTVQNGRVYAASDDGYVYCLDAEDGHVVWKLRAGPTDDWILGRQQMVSRWPIRSGILVDQGTAYFTAGIFPHENIYLYAVRAEDGNIVWKIDNISEEDAGRNDLSPQGYPLVNDEFLFVPSGRSLPAAIDRKTGHMVYKRSYGWRRDAGGVVGGSRALLADGQLYSFGAEHLLAMDQRTGNIGFGWFAARQMAVTGDAAYVADGTNIGRLDRIEYAKASRVRHRLEMEIYDLSRKLKTARTGADAMRKQLRDKQAKVKELSQVGFRWKTKSAAVSSLIVAGNLVFAGDQGHVTAFSVTDGKLVWQADVDGEARELAVANGTLFVSTSTGKIYGFSSEPSRKMSRPAMSESIVNAPFPRDAWTAMYEHAAEQILKVSGIQKGFCLVLGSEQGRLAFELAKRSQLTIYGLEPDAEKVAASRRALSSAGLYGNRITIHQAELSPVPYPSYFANLIVSDTLLQTGRIPGTPAEVARHLKPLGGQVVFGSPSASHQPGFASGGVSPRQWLGAMKLDEQATIHETDSWVVLTRGKLPGAGSWTHQYAGPGNTACSDDQVVKGGLGVLWYGDPGEGAMVNRHEGAVGPLAVNGRLFIQGQDRIMAFDAYNGLFLWEIKNPDSIRTGVFQNQNPGNLVASDDSLYFMKKDTCYRIDAATGQIIRKYPLPESISKSSSHEWGYLAYHDGMLFGTATIRKELAQKRRHRGKVTEDTTDAIFSIDPETGKYLWVYSGKNILHNTLAIGDEGVFFIDSSISSTERAALLRQDKTELKKLTGQAAQLAEDRMKRLDCRLAVALDPRTGVKSWSKPVDVTDCSEIGTGGGKLTLMVHNNVLILCGANANGHYWKQFLAGEFKRRRLVALSAEDGHKLWATDANYRHRPIVVEDQVVAEPWAFDLYTGAQRMRANPLTGELEPWSIMRSGHHCGMISAAPHMLLFRAGFTGFYDLDADDGTRHFAGHRTGCWINMIPANGLLSIPEASAGCVCLFSIASTVVMEPRETNHAWGIVSSTGAKTPIGHLALNLGAPGDRRDAHGTIWLAYPRPKPSKVTGLDLAFDLGTQFLPDGSFVSRNSQVTKVAGTQIPWVYASWASGLTRCSLPLLAKGDAPATYNLKLHFADLTNQAPGIRQFDIKVQGKTVIEDFDVVAEARGQRTAVVREVPGINVSDNMVIELVPKQKKPDKSHQPILSGIEVVRVF